MPKMITTRGDLKEAMRHKREIGRAITKMQGDLKKIKKKGTKTKLRKEIKKLKLLKQKVGVGEKLVKANLVMEKRVRQMKTPEQAMKIEYEYVPSYKKRSAELVRKIKAFDKRIKTIK
jgi:hypothetical protein